MAPASLALKIVWTIALILVIGGVGLFLANLVNRILRVRADKKHSFKLVNNGNISSRYHLSFESVQSGLAFKCLDNKIPLVPVMQQVEEVPEPEAAPLVNLQSLQPVTAEHQQVKTVSAKPGEALKAGKSVGSKIGVAASLLGTIGGQLPGKLGQGLKEKAGMARGVQFKTAEVIRAPQDVTDQMDELKTSSGRLGVNSNQKEEKSPRAENSTLAAASPTTAQLVMPVYGNHATGISPVTLKDTGWVQTRELGSGEALVLTLLIGKTTRRYPVGSFNYDIKSQQVPMDGRFAIPAPLTKTGTVYIKPISTWRYFLPMIGSSLVLLLAFLGIFYGLTYLWG